MEEITYQGEVDIQDIRQALYNAYMQGREDVGKIDIISGFERMVKWNTISVSNVEEDKQKA